MERRWSPYASPCGNPHHGWPARVEEARAIQEVLRRRVVTCDRLGRIRRVAGVDASYEHRSGRVCAAVAVLALPELAHVEHVVVRRKARFPYLPGYLSFREAPAVLAALEKLRCAPDLLLCDGQGYAHPRRFGLACHLGLLADLPSIGVAKSLLVGTHGDVPEQKGGWAPLVQQGEVIGAVLRTRAGVRPLYVSIGHRISLETAIARVIACTPRYRLPEPIRQAHRLASASCH
jgi:deoxyribonuclease V